MHPRVESAGINIGVVIHTVYRIEILAYNFARNIRVLLPTS